MCLCEIRLQIPAGSRLIGTRTEENTVIVVYEEIQQEPEPEPKIKIGYDNYKKPAEDQPQ